MEDKRENAKQFKSLQHLLRKAEINRQKIPKKMF